ncbi:hypothetical protein I4U23_014277 [Adineta vaga]|nr:hypothetical protein I4U23_014277 [Adineta vaga]
MFYNGQSSPGNKWSSTVQYSNYQPDRRLKLLWLLILAIITLILSVAALIIVFAVEHSWFSDSYNKTTNFYGLWRLCINTTQTCDSWFSSNGPHSVYIDDRHNRDRVGINAWQALEIVFLFLITSTLIITLISIIFYRLRSNIHYYLAILAGFVIWPAVMVGIAALFVFGFSVYNVSPAPHALDWCFYVNLVAVILSIFGAILLTVYDILMKKPIKMDLNTSVPDTFTDYNSYPPQSNSPTYVVVRRNKKHKKIKESYDYPQVLHPQQYLPPATTINTNTDYITNPNHRMLTTPYTTAINNQPVPPPPIPQHPSLNAYRSANLLASPSTISVPRQTQFYQSSIPTYPFQPAHWHRTGDTANDYIQRGIYRPARLNPPERSFEQREEPARVLHYYTGYDHFSAVDSTDPMYARNYPLPSARPISPIRYPVNPPYYHQNNYIKSAL